MYCRIVKVFNIEFNRFRKKQNPCQIRFELKIYNFHFAIYGKIIDNLNLIQTALNFRD